jgi:16S rRNA (guanine527-N7)-methyltransferase
LFLKGRDIQGEIEAAEAEWRFDLELVASVTDAEGRIAVVRNVAAKTEG